MSLNTITDAVRELLSPEQWTIVRCATVIGVHLTEVQRSIVNCVTAVGQVASVVKCDLELLCMPELLNTYTFLFIEM